MADFQLDTLTQPRSQAPSPLLSLSNHVTRQPRSQGPLSTLGTRLVTRQTRFLSRYIRIHCADKAHTSQVAQARYMSSSMLTFAPFRNSSDLHIYMDLYGK